MERHARPGDRRNGPLAWPRRARRSSALPSAKKAAPSTTPTSDAARRHGSQPTQAGVVDGVRARAGGSRRPRSSWPPPRRVTSLPRADVERPRSDRLARRPATRSPLPDDRREPAADACRAQLPAGCSGTIRTRSPPWTKYARVAGDRGRVRAAAHPLARPGRCARSAGPCPRRHGRSPNTGDRSRCSPPRARRAPGTARGPDEDLRRPRPAPRWRHRRPDGAAPLGAAPAAAREAVPRHLTARAELHGVGPGHAVDDGGERGRSARRGQRARREQLVGIDVAARVDLLDRRRCRSTRRRWPTAA